MVLFFCLFLQLPDSKDQIQSSCILTKSMLTFVKDLPVVERWDISLLLPQIVRSPFFLQIEQYLSLSTIIELLLQSPKHLSQHGVAIELLVLHI